MYFAPIFDFWDDMLMFSKWHICFVLTLKRQFVTENTADMISRAFYLMGPFSLAVQDKI